MLTVDRDPIANSNGLITAQEKEALKEEFARDGYFVIRKAVSPEQLAELHKTLESEFANWTKSEAQFSGGGFLSGHLNCFPGEASRFVYDTLRDRGIIDLIKELDARVIRMPNVGCNFNLPGSHTQHYHLDRPFARDFMIANVAVVDTNVENGAMEAIPGTHKKHYKYTRFVLDRVARSAVRMTLNRGDLLVRTSNVWHRGTANKTAAPRPMLAFTWEDGGSSHVDPFAADDGNIRFIPNWFKPTKVGRLREKLFVRVPAAYSALRFARSLVDREY